MIELITTTKKIKSDKTDLLLLFETDGISRVQYKYLIDKLDDFKSYISAEYLVNSKTHYDRCSGNLLIELILTIPNDIVPKDVKRGPVIDDIINKFIKFYESQIENLNRNP
jgi:hypothetical protein